MKKLSILIIVLFLIIGSQTSCKKEKIAEDLIYNGNVLFYSFNTDEHAEILRKIEGKEVINGTLRINTNFKELNKLQSIKKVTKSVIIEDVVDITNLMFLRNIEEIGGDLGISLNKDLLSLDGLEKIKSVESLYISDCHKLKNIDAISEIKVSNDFWLTGYCHSSISKFENIVRLSGDIKIENNTQIEDLIFLTNLSHVGGSLVIRNNRIKTLTGLNKLDSIGDFLYIDKANNKLQDLSGLQNLKVVNGDFILNGMKLKNLLGLENLKSVTGTFNINRTSCVSIDGINNLINVNKILLYDNKKLDNFCSIKQLLLTDQSYSFKASGNLIDPSASEIIGSCP